MYKISSSLNLKIILVILIYSADVKYRRNVSSAVMFLCIRNPLSLSMSSGQRPPPHYHNTI